MSSIVRVIALGGAMGAVVAGTLAAPALISAVAEEPAAIVTATVQDLFGPELIDPDKFVRFKITIDDTVSTEVLSRREVTKIGHGHKSTVAIVRTPTGTYSSDAIVSPHVRYPGIEVSSNPSWSGLTPADLVPNGVWVFRVVGSFVYLSQIEPTRS